MAEMKQVLADVDLTVHVKGVQPVTCRVGEVTIELSAEGAVDEQAFGDVLAEFLEEAAGVYRTGGA